MVWNLILARTGHILCYFILSLFSNLKWFYFILFDLVLTRCWCIFGIFINKINSFWIRWNKCFFYSIFGYTNIRRVLTWPTIWISLGCFRSTLNSLFLRIFSKFIINWLIKTWIWTIISMLRCVPLSLRHLKSSNRVLIHKVVTILIMARPRTTIIIISFLLRLKLKWWSTWRRLNIIVARSNLTWFFLANNIWSFSSGLLKWFHLIFC